MKAPLGEITSFKLDPLALDKRNSYFLYTFMSFEAKEREVVCLPRSIYMWNQPSFWIVPLLVGIQASKGLT